MKKIGCNHGGMLFGTLLFTLISAGAAWAQNAGSVFLKADLVPFNQVPAVLAGSVGIFTAEVENGTMSYSLSYSNMSSSVEPISILAPARPMAG